MDLSPLIELFMLGLSGTGHCLGMCGPLVIAFPGKTGRIGPHFSYHAGRIATYTGVGVVMGSLGLAVAALASVAGFDYLAAVARAQLLFSLLAGLFLCLFGLGQLGITGQPAWLTLASPEKIPGYRRLVRSAYLKADPVLMVVTGLFMGFLPCGLSFAAFSRALAVSRPLEGGAFLLAFGLGTLPGLLLMGTGVGFIMRRYQRQFDIFSGMLMIAMGTSLLVDGIAAIL